MVLGAIVCMGMGLWQLARYQEASGTVQNLGYTFMWPFLAGFLVYAYFKYVRLEAEEEERIADELEEMSTGAGASAEGSPRSAGSAGVTAGVAGPSGAMGRIGLDDDDNPTSTPPRSPRAGTRPGASGSRSGATGRGTRRGREMTEIPADLLPTRRPSTDEQVQDEGLAAYNSYLAELARKDGLGTRSQEKPAS